MCMGLQDYIASQRQSHAWQASSTDRRTKDLKAEEVRTLRYNHMTKECIHDVRAFAAKIGLPV